MGEDAMHGRAKFIGKHTDGMPAVSQGLFKLSQKMRQIAGSAAFYAGKQFRIKAGRGQTIGQLPAGIIEQSETVGRHGV